MKKTFITLAISCFLIAVVMAQGSKELTKNVISSTVVTGIVKLDPKYKMIVWKSKAEKTPHTKDAIALDSAIVNDKIMFEGVKYTLNEKTFKLTTRTKQDSKEFAGGANIGGAFLMVAKVEKNYVHFTYRHSEFDDAVNFKKRLKKRTRYGLEKASK